MQSKLVGWALTIQWHSKTTFRLSKWTSRFRYLRSWSQSSYPHVHKCRKVIWTPFWPCLDLVSPTRMSCQPTCNIRMSLGSAMLSVETFTDQSSRRRFYAHVAIQTGIKEVVLATLAVHWSLQLELSLESCPLALRRVAPLAFHKASPELDLTSAGLVMSLALNYDRWKGFLLKAQNKNVLSQF